MLALVFEVAGERYALRASKIVEVVRRPPTRSVPGAPPWIDGLCARGGGWIPVVDLSILIAGVPCAEGAATRVAFVERAEGGLTRQLGLLAGGMTRVLDFQETAATGVFLKGREFLGPIILSDQNGVQLVDADRMIPKEVDRLLFGAIEEATGNNGDAPAAAAPAPSDNGFTPTLIVSKGVS
jgi:chemotaxis-related protein WspB